MNEHKEKLLSWIYSYLQENIDKIDSIEGSGFGGYNPEITIRLYDPEPEEISDFDDCIKDCLRKKAEKKRKKGFSIQKCGCYFYEVKDESCR